MCEGKEGALGGALGDTALGLFDAEGNVRSSDLLSEEGGPSAPIDIDPSSDVVSEDTVNGTIVGVTALSLRSEEHTSELQSLMRISYAVFCLNKKKNMTSTT